jgi:hypothetical protein
MNTIQEGIDNIYRWIVENPYAPVEIPLPSIMERKTYHYSLEKKKRNKNKFGVPSVGMKGITRTNV